MLLVTTSSITNSDLASLHAIHLEQMASTPDSVTMTSPTQAQQPPRRRAFHHKSRAGCLTCKKRQHCMSCQRLQLKCVYATQDSTTKANESPRSLKALLPAQRSSSASPLSQNFWTPEETARAIVHDAFSRLDPTGNTGDNPFLWMPRESHTNESYKYICLAMKDLSNSRSAIVRQMGFLPLKVTRGPGRPSAESKDPHVLSAVRNYTKAISIFRSTLGSGLPTREIVCGTFLFAIIEAMRGNYTSQHTIMLAGVMLLRPLVVSTYRDDGSAIYGIAHGDRDILGVEALVLRSAAHARLSGKTKGRSCSNPAQGRVPDFRLPMTFPTPDSMDSVPVLQHKWGVLHVTLESWQLSRYWYIVAGVPVNARRHLVEQDRLRTYLQMWLDFFRGLRILKRPPPSTAPQGLMAPDKTDNHKRALPNAWDLMITYVQCLLLAMATPDTSNSVSKEGQRRSEFYDQSPMQTQKYHVGQIERDSLRALLSHLRSDIDGFSYPANHTLNYDRLMLPLITAEAVEQLNTSQRRTAHAFRASSRRSSQSPADMDQCLSSLQQELPPSAIPSTTHSSVQSSSVNSSSHTRASSPSLHAIGSTAARDANICSTAADPVTTIQDEQPPSVIDQQLTLMNTYCSITKDIFQDHELAIAERRMRDFPFMPLSVRKRFTLAGILGPALMEEWALKASGKGAGINGIMV